jgi:hypothetical protein
MNLAGCEELRALRIIRVAPPAAGAADGGRRPLS